jgi:hypothetical protein
MKITKSQLKQIIKEELEVELEEGRFTDFMDVFFPSASEAEKRRKIYAMSDEEIQDMKAQAAAEEEAAYEREAGILQPDEEIPGEQDERDDQLDRMKDAEKAMALADREKRLRDRAKNAASEREKREAELEANRISSDRAAKERAERKAKRTRELAAATKRNQEKRAAARANLEEAILQKIIGKLK